MKRKALVAVGVTACLAATASADFVDFTGEVTDLGSGVSAIDMYANFSNADNVFLNIYNCTMVNGDGIANGGFYHLDFATLSGGEGSWLPSQSADVAGLSSLYDSYVTAGYASVGASNSTALDPNFLNNGNGLGAYVPETAGWYNGNPDNVISGDKIHLGHFVMATSDVGFFNFSASTGWKADAATTEVQFGSGSWTVPAPGALALLGLGGLATRRRRTN